MDIPDIPATLDQLLKQAKASFSEKFGLEATIAVAAPGRVNVIGDHTDYTEGLAMPMAINRWTVFVGAPQPEQTSEWEIFSAFLSNSITIDCNKNISPANDKGDYARGVLSEYQPLIQSLNGHKVYCTSNLEVGAGLSSSASFSVGLATYIESASNIPENHEIKIQRCRKAENDFAGVPCGILDQFSIVNGKKNALMQLDCRSQTAQQLKLNDNNLTWLIVPSGVSHQLSDGGYAKRFEQCQTIQKILGCSLRDASINDLSKLDDPILYKRALHVVSENQRVMHAAKAIQQQDWQHFGKLMFESHYSLRDNYQSSCKETDYLVDIAKTLPGILGARITGGGFGGAIIILAQTNDISMLKKKLCDDYESKSSIKTNAWPVVPSNGCNTYRC